MTTKISVTVDDGALAQARALAPGGNLSVLVNDALTERVRRERLRAILDEDQRAIGLVSGEADPHVSAEWPFSSSTPAS
jgi:hypothetical protein